ncbi:MAG: cytochrome c peroxidase [Alphaproteobacteria bacterium]|jgi:cytochrome c peroxidase
MHFFITLFTSFSLLCITLYAQNKALPNHQLSKKLFDIYADSYQEPQEDDVINHNLVQLGKKIFFDIRFSSDGKMACGTCHIPEKAFSDNHPKAIGNNGKALQRRAMTLYHLSHDTQFFWDGRGKSLEAQFAEALKNPLEMDFSFERAINIMKYDKQYQTLFLHLNKNPTEAIITQAVVSYVKSIKPPKTQFDAWVKGDLTALTHQELKGFELFNNKANCTACHMGYQFKDNLMNDIGLADNDLGLGAVTKNPNDFHMFKTPSLRGITYRAPYMHDGSLVTLKDVIDHYNAPIFKRGNTDIPIPEEQGDIIAFHNFTQPLNLTDSEIEDLIAFLKIL